MIKVQTKNLSSAVQQMLLEEDMLRLPVRYLNLNLLITEFHMKSGTREDKWMTGFHKDSLETMTLYREDNLKGLLLVLVIQKAL